MDHPQQYQTTYTPREHLLVDVRSPEEFATGHIPGAVNIALPNLPQRMATLPHDQPIILYCRSGARSHEAVKILAQGGFSDIHDLGGITEWRNQGLPVS
jgi:phage shock protein E